MKERRLPYIKKTGFVAPEGYFEEFENRILQKAGITTPVIPEKLPSSYGVPAGYFETFDARLLEKLEKKQKVVRLHPGKTISYIAGVAAALLVLISSIVLSKSQEPGFEDLEISAVETYLFETLDMNEEGDLEVMEEENFSFSTHESQIDKEALLEYLNEHVEEPSILFYSD